MLKKFYFPLILLCVLSLNISAQLFEPPIDNLFSPLANRSGIDFIQGDSKISNSPTVCVAPPANLVSWYRAENNANDAQGANNGTLGGSAIFTTGKAGQAFQTTSTTGNTVTIPDSPSLSFTNAFTIEMWVSLGQVGSNNGTSFLTCKGDCGSFGGFSYALILNNTTSNVILRLGNGSTFDSLFSSPLPLNTFTHVAATYDGTTRQIYLNGVLDASATSAIGTLLDSSQSLYIGGSNVGNALGIYDEASFYNRVLSASEIQAIFNAGTDGKCRPAATTVPSGLVAWFAGDGSALDSRSRNNGTLRNGVTFEAGEVGQAFNLDGSDDSIRINASPSLDVGTSGGMTVETWIRPTQISTQQVLVEWLVGSGLGAHFVLSSTDGAPVPGNLYANIIDSGGIPHKIESAGGLVSANVYQHVALTYDKTTGIANLFLNGAVVATQNLGNFTPRTNGTLFLGARNTVPATLLFGGGLDETSIYNRALSTAEMQAIFNAGTAGKFKPTATVSPNNQITWLAGDGNANDIAGTNNGTLQNGATFAVGKVGQSFNLDGTNDFVSLGDPANLKFTNTNFTVEGWFMTPDVPNNPGTQCGARYPIFGYDFGYTVEIGGDGRLRLRKSTSQSDTLAINTLNPLSPNVFHHFAAIHTPTEMRLYVDGVLDNTLPIANGNIFYFGGDVPELGRFTCGTGGVIDFYFKGQIDETSIYNRALTDAEIGSIFNAGIAGKLKQNAAVDISNLISLYQGENNAVDTFGANNGTFAANTYATGRVGQAFNFTSSQGVIVPDSATFNQQNFTLEAFITAVPYSCPGGPNDCQAFVIAKSGSNGQFGYEFGVREAGKLRFSLNGGAGGADLVGIGTVNDGNFHHVAATYDGTTMKIYIDGVLDSQTATAATVNYQANSQFYIGSRQFTGGSTVRHPGKIDEAAFYNRALTAAEIRTDYEVGNALSTVVGDARISASIIPAAGTIQQIPLVGSLLPDLPFGMPTGLFYDIASNQSVTNPTVCFNLPSFTPAQFPDLRIYHLEAGAWQPRTATSNTYPTLCTSGLPSLSPFAIGFNVPTAASVLIGGRVRSANGKGIARARISLTDSSGAVRETATDFYGRYRFDDVPAGATYIISASHRRIQFEHNTQVRFVGEEDLGIDFVAIE